MRTGVEYVVDAIICPTGFDISSCPAFPLIGRNGVDQSDFWKEQPLYYFVVAALGFPNYFSKSRCKLLGLM
jgi:hypothetical protein